MTGLSYHVTGVKCLRGPASVRLDDALLTRLKSIDRSGVFGKVT